MTAQPTLTLFNGSKMPVVGLGTWKSQPGAVGEAVKAGFAAGYRHIDCAAVYSNEKEIGEAFEESFKTIPRESVFITSKLWNTKHHPDDVKSALKETLSDLRLEYLDLYLIHWPIGSQRGSNPFPKDDAGNMIYSDDHYVDTWKVLEECVDEGLVKSIGLSNFNSKQIQDVLDNCRIQPAVLQIECHPYLNQMKLIEFCKQKNIVVTAYSPLGSGDRPWAKPDDPRLLEDETLKSLAEKYNKSVAQICIAFQVNRGITVIPKSVSAERIKQNFDVLDFKISDEDMITIYGLNKPWRACIPMILVDGKAVPRDGGHKFFPFHEEY